jgi:hypothetical protein
MVYTYVDFTGYTVYMFSNVDWGGGDEVSEETKVRIAVRNRPYEVIFRNENKRNDVKTSCNVWM